ncbi:MAG: permease-like cell division protein FtsX [Clostridium sp.]|nr:permease-like cell division protein FtsX [Clostridium sp.]
MSREVDTAMKITSVKYSLIDALKSLKRNKTLRLASIITVSLTLLMFGIFLLAMLNANEVIKSVESKLEVSVFLKEDVKQSEKENIQNVLKGTNGVLEVNYVTKDQALQKWKEQLGEENKDLVQGFDKKNPLPESFTVRLQNGDIVQAVVDNTKNLPGVYRVVANEDLVNRISSLTKGIKWVGLAALFILVPICLLLIGNTIKLAVYSRRREVNIMKFVGATDWFIRWPFIIEGVIIGLVGSLISGVLLNYSYKFIYHKLSSTIIMLNLVTPKFFIMNVLWVFVLTGVLIGGLGSILSIRKFLKV